MAEDPHELLEQLFEDDSLPKLNIGLGEALTRRRAVELELAKKNQEVDDLKKEKAQLDVVIRDGLMSIGMRQLQTDGGVTVFLKKERLAKINASNKPKVLQWMKDNGFGHMVQPDCNTRTIQKLFKELAEADAPIPGADVCEFWDRPTVGYRGLKQ